MSGKTKSTSRGDDAAPCRWAFFDQLFNDKAEDSEKLVELALPEQELRGKELLSMLLPPEEKPCAVAEEVAGPSTQFASVRLQYGTQGIRGEVFTCWGEHVEMNLSLKATSLQLKDAIAEKLSVPVIFQQLLEIIFRTPIRDHERIVQQEYQMVITMARVEKILEHGSDVERIRTLVELGKLGLRGGSRSITAVCSCLGRRGDTSGDYDVRLEAIWTLPKLAERGNTEAILMVERLLDHSDRVVRGAAVRALAQVAPEGDQDIIAKTIELLEDADIYVQTAAVRALAEVSLRGDLHVITAMGRLLEKAVCVELRSSAIETLIDVAERGNQDAIIAVKAFLDDEHEFVRREAVRAMESLTERGDPRTTVALLRRLHDQDTLVRLKAILGLASVVVMGDQQTITLVSNCLEDCDVRVRLAVVQTLAQVARKGDPHAIVAVSRFLNHRGRHAREAAVRALAQVTQRGDQQVIHTLSLLFKDFDGRVREAAVHAMAEVAHKGNLPAIQAVSSLLHDADASVRREAAGVLTQLCPDVIKVPGRPHGNVQWPGFQDSCYPSEVPALQTRPYGKPVLQASRWMRR